MKKYGDKGFTIQAFPCNQVRNPTCPFKKDRTLSGHAKITHLPSSIFLSPQFGFQEPGSNEEIKAFAAAKGFTGMYQLAS